jgi:hypothetical protein
MLKFVGYSDKRASKPNCLRTNRSNPCSFKHTYKVGEDSEFFRIATQLHPSLHHSFLCENAQKCAIPFWLDHDPEGQLRTENKMIFLNPKE